MKLFFKRISFTNLPFIQLFLKKRLYLHFVKQLLWFKLAVKFHEILSKIPTYNVILRDKTYVFVIYNIFIVTITCFIENNFSLNKIHILSLRQYISMKAIQVISNTLKKMSSNENYHLEIFRSNYKSTWYIYLYL